MKSPRRSGSVNEVFAQHSRDSVSEWLEESLGRLPELEVRKMFGGAGIYAEGTMFGILSRGRVYLKTDDSNREAFVDRGMKPFQPRRGTTLKSYYEVPVEVLDDDAEFLRWARRALAVASAARR
ncbi:MAG TPA: TfoX/Sxy family protein [Polyangiaceae bacterium]